jgi:hypothetical protein
MARMTQRTLAADSSRHHRAAVPDPHLDRPAGATLRAAISATHAIFFLLAAPVWCAAQNRNGPYCRNPTRSGFSS